MRSRLSIDFTPLAVAAVLVLTLACETAPDTETSEPGIAELHKAAPAECLTACRLVVACLGGGYGSSGGGYGEYGGGYGGAGYGCGYGECGMGPSSPEWCGYGGYGDGYGGYGSLPGYGGTCTGSGTNMLDQCVAGCRALPTRARRHLLTCVSTAHTCQARLACE